MEKKVTIKDLAAKLHLSTNSISAALNNSGRLAPDTRKRVLEAADQMGYIPNSAAQRLKGSSTHTIGVYGVPYVSTLNQALFHDFSIELSRRGYNLITAYGIGIEAEKRAIRRLISQGVDGIIVTCNTSPEILPETVPYVFCPPAAVDNFDFAVDFALGTYQAAQYLIQKKRKNFAMLFAGVSNPYGQKISDRKLAGLNRALAEAGLPASQVLYTEQFSCQAEEIFQEIARQKFDAILCGNDYLGMMLIQVLQQHQFHIPQDIMVVGFDGLTICNYCAVPLATVIQPNAELAKQATQLLLERIAFPRTPHSPQKRLLAPQFYPADSCGFPRSRQLKLFHYETYPTLEQNIQRENIVNEL